MQVNFKLLIEYFGYFFMSSLIKIIFSKRYLTKQIIRKSSCCFH